MEYNHSSHEVAEVFHRAEEHLAELLLCGHIDGISQVTAFVLVREAAVDDDETELVPGPLLDHQLTQVGDTYAVLTAFFLLRNDLGLAVFTEGGRDISELGESHLPLVFLLLTSIDNGKWHVRLNDLIICAIFHDLTT